MLPTTRTLIRGWALLAVMCIAGAAIAGDRHITLDDLGREVGLSSAVISPDGREIAVLVSRADFIDNRQVRSLTVIDIASGAQRQLAETRTSISSPQWSPDGARMAWLDVAENGTTQIYVHSPGDSNARPKQVTNASRGIQSYGWTAAGNSFVFIASEDQAPRVDRYSTAFEVTLDNDFLSSSAPVPTYLELIDAAGGEARRLTSGPHTIKGFIARPQGDAVVFASEPGARRTGNLRATLNAVDVRTGEQRALLDAPGLEKSPLQALLATSPNGKYIAYSRARGPQPAFRSNVLTILSLADGQERKISDSIDRSFGRAVWMPDGNSMIAVAADGTRDSAWQLHLQGGTTKLDLGGVTQLSDLSISKRGVMAFVGSQAGQPPELYVMTSPRTRPRSLTRFNSNLATLDLGEVTTLRWQHDGFELNGVLTYPPGFQRGRQYPLVLSIHGGPMSTSTAAFNGFDQLLAAQGWLVFAPNYRGSISAGDKFQSAIIDDAGDGPAGDVMAGIAAVKALGIVDEQRIAVSGWSYGGFLTAWLTSHYSGWRAAVAAAAVTDWFDSYSLSDVNDFFGFGLGGSPWRNDNAANYWRQSPIAQAHRIRTPMLILSTTGDTRVPPTQSYKLFRALRDNQVPVQFIAYAQGGHMPSDPANQRDWYRRWMGWIDGQFQSAAKQ